MLRAMMLTAVLMAGGAGLSFAGTGQKTADSTKAFVCDTAKCKSMGCHADAMKNCPLRNGKKCTMADSAQCMRMHGKTGSTGFACDTAKCRSMGNHADNKKACPIHQAMKCNMSASAECMHQKADTTKQH